MGTYIVTGDGRKDFLSLLKKELDDSVKGVDAIIISIDDENDASISPQKHMEKYAEILNKIEKPIHIQRR